MVFCYLLGSYHLNSLSRNGRKSIWCSFLLTLFLSSIKEYSIRRERRNEGARGKYSSLKGYNLRPRVFDSCMAWWLGFSEDDSASTELRYAVLLMSIGGLAPSTASSVPAHLIQPTALPFSWRTVYYLAFPQGGKHHMDRNPVCLH